jgi:hypothetical protein
MSAPVSRLTSAYLQQCLDEPLGEVVPPTVSRSRRPPDPSPMRDWVGAALLYQYEGLHHVLDGGPFSEIEKGALAAELDDFLCRLFIRTVPDMIRRLLKFDRIVTEQRTNENVEVYFQEAMHCCALGLPAAAVALGRACLEQALLDTIQLPHAKTLNLDSLIAAAGLLKVLDAGHLQMAREVQGIGNQVLHRQPCTDEQVLDAIVNVRAVVEQLYGPAPDE